MPRTTYAQASAGTPVGSLDALLPGDLIFLPGSDGTAVNPGHVGLYLGHGLLIHAPQTGEVVRVATVASWAAQIVAIRRP